MLLERSIRASFTQQHPSLGRRSIENILDNVKKSCDFAVVIGVEVNEVGDFGLQIPACSYHPLDPGFSHGLVHLLLYLSEADERKHREHQRAFASNIHGTMGTWGKQRSASREYLAARHGGPDWGRVGWTHSLRTGRFFTGLDPRTSRFY